MPLYRNPSYSGVRARRGRPSRRGRPFAYKRPKGAVKRVVRSTKYRKSARSQARQIASVGRAVVRVQKQLREDQNSTSIWQTMIENHELDADTGLGTAVNKGIFVIPLTSGPGQGDNAAISSLQTTIKDASWLQVQPQVRQTEGTQATKAGPAWIKLYTQTVRMCFYQNNMNRGNKYHMFVIRLRRDKDTNLSNTMMARLADIDGTAYQGRPDNVDRFTNGEDFYATQGFRGPTPTDAGGTDPLGYELVRFNPERYEVVHSRSFALGRSLGPVASTAAIGPTSGGSSTQHARDFYETSFRINYGGAKLMAPDDDADTSQSPITISDVKYADINPKLKHWIVIMPQRASSTTATTGVTRFSLLSNVTCKVPT